MKKIAVRSVGKLIPKAKFLITKHSPEIFLGAGVIAIIGGTILACKESRYLNDILDNHEGRKIAVNDEFEDAIGDADTPEERAVAEKIYRKDMVKCNVDLGIELGRMYIPAALCITGGIGMIVQGHRILSQRNAVLLAAYTALDQSFTEYRIRVADRYGGDTEQEIYSGTTYKTETKTEIGEDGKKKKVKTLTPVPFGATLSPYSRMFDEQTSREWTRSPDFNRTFLICQQNQMNDKLIRNGYLFASDVERALGFDETPTGRVCGWILPKDGSDISEGDQYVDFGMVFDPETGNALLDFNCQGLIYDKI